MIIERYASPDRQCKILYADEYEESDEMNPSKVVSRDEWLAARKELLAKEKEPREEDSIWDPRDES
jgi:hypothetical protein